MSIKTEYNTIKIELKDTIATLYINRPDKLNALNSEVLTELREALKEINNSCKDLSIRGLIVTGTGEKAFIAGADISEMRGMEIEEIHRFGKLGQEVTVLFEKLPIPVVAAVNGYALGGGLEMALSADFIYAIDSAVLGLPEVKLGLIPGFGGTQRLSRLIPRAMAKELIYTGRNVKISEAIQMGIVNRSFSSLDELYEACHDVLVEMFKNGPLAIANAKKAIREGVDLKVNDGLSIELQAFTDIFKTEDAQEGTSAFLEKRKADFKGL